MRLITLLAGRYVAGDTLRDELRAVRRLNLRGMAATCDFLGENVLKKGRAEKATRSYIRILESLHLHHSDANISVKLSQLGLDIDESFCKKNMEQILARARELNNFVWLDMESSAYTDRAISMYKFFAHNYKKHLGICIQAYLRRSESDIKGLISLHPNIRLVKGAYKESSQLSFPQKKDVDDNYRHLAKLLLTSGPGLIALATHDERIVHDLIGWMKKNKIHANRVEFQMLYGIRKDLQQKLAKAGYKVRIYTPFGRQWFPYFYRRLRERKENLFFALKSLFHR